MTRVSLQHALARGAEGEERQRKSKDRAHALARGAGGEERQGKSKDRADLICAPDR